MNSVIAQRNFTALLSTLGLSAMVRFMYVLASKTKAAPLKSLTIPRLELLACLLLSKLINEILVGLQNRIQLEDIFCWTDSEVALCWINGKEKSWEPWVENKVVAIRKVVDRTKWNFVKGELNPADIPTKLSSNLVECFSGCWFDGPVMLSSQVVESHAGRGDEISLVGREELELGSFSSHQHEQFNTEGHT